MKNLFLLFLISFSFSFNSVEVTTPGEEQSNLCEGDYQFSCTPPNAPSVPFITTDNQNYLRASSRYPLGADGVEWTVSGSGFLISGQGTGVIEIGPDCPIPATITVCVVAYNLGSGGAICYSATNCTTFTYNGWCFI